MPKLYLLIIFGWSVRIRKYITFSLHHYPSILLFLESRSKFFVSFFEFYSPGVISDYNSPEKNHNIRLALKTQFEDTRCFDILIYNLGNPTGRNRYKFFKYWINKHELVHLRWIKYTLNIFEKYSTWLKLSTNIFQYKYRSSQEVLFWTHTMIYVIITLLRQQSFNLLVQRL